MANWYAENQRNIERFEDASAQMRVGKISGAVGNASHLGPEMKSGFANGWDWTWRR